MVSTIPLDPYSISKSSKFINIETLTIGHSPRLTELVMVQSAATLRVPSECSVRRSYRGVDLHTVRASTTAQNRPQNPPVRAFHLLPRCDPAKDAGTYTQPGSGCSRPNA